MIRGGLHRRRLLLLSPTLVGMTLGPLATAGAAQRGCVPSNAAAASRSAPSRPTSKDSRKRAADPSATLLVVGTVSGKTSGTEFKESAEALPGRAERFRPPAGFARLTTPERPRRIESLHRPSYFALAPPAA